MKRFYLFVVLLTGMYFVTGTTGIADMIPKPKPQSNS
jgi:hypothetical protein